MKKNLKKATATLVTSALVASLFTGAIPTEVQAATEHWNDASTEKVAWENWKANWDAYSSNYENVSLTPGINETQLNFAWYSRTEGDAKVQIATNPEMTDAKVFNGTQENAVVIANEQYISNKVTVTDLQENTQYYYQVMKNGQWTEAEAYSTKSFSNFSFLYVGDPQIGASRSQTSAEVEKANEEYEAALAQYEKDYADYEKALAEYEASVSGNTVSNNGIEKPVAPVEPEKPEETGTLNGVNSVETTAKQNLAARNDSYNWNKVLKLAVEDHANVSFMVSAGDQVNYAKNEREYAGYLGAEALKSLPVATTIGNHDSGSNQYSLHYNNPNTLSGEAYTTGKTAAGTDYYYTYGDVLFIVIDTNNYNCGTHANVIKKAISENQDAKWRVVMFHQDIYGSGLDHSDSDGMVLRTQLTPVFDENDIDVVLQGHDHTYSRSYQLQGDGKEHTAYNNSNYRNDPDFKVQNNCYEIVDETVGTVVNPEGTVYFEANSATGSKFYELIASQQDFIAERSQTWTPSYSLIDVTEDTFTVTPYDATTGKPMFGSSSYTIVKKEAAKDTTVTGTASYTKTLGDKAFTLDAKADSEGKVTYESANEDVAVVSTKGKVTLTGAGTTTITVKVAATETQKEAEKEITITVKDAPKQEPEKEIVKEVIGTQKIDAKSSVTKTYGAKAFNLNAKATGALTYTTSNKKVATVDNAGKVTIKGTGKAVITIKAAATDKVQEATKEVTITVKPKKQTATVSNKTKKQLKISWKKDTKATGYEVVYASNKAFTKNVTTVNVKKNSTKSYKAKKLQKGKTYYVRVRSYKTVDGERIYGAYSTAVKVQVK